MDEYRFLQLLNDDSNFYGNGTLHALDVVQHTDETKSICRATKLEQSSVSDWLNQEGEFEVKRDPGVVAELRVISVSNNQQRLSMAYKPVIPMSKHLFLETLEQLHLPKLFLASLMQNIAICHKVHTREADQYQQFVLQSKSSEECFSLSMSCDSEAHVTTILLFGTDDEIVAELFRRLEFMNAHIAAPMLFATLLIDVEMEYINRIIEQCHSGIRTIKIQTGLAQTPSVPSRSLCSPTVDEAAQTADVTTISKDLTRIRAKLVQCRHYIETMQPIVPYLEVAGSQCMEGVQSEEHRARMRTSHALRKAMDSLNIKYLQSTNARLKHLLARSDAYVQTVYSLIAQSDNASNIKMAEASMQVAEYSRQENIAMRQIAEDSRRIAEDSKAVALATSRDSAAMRTISFVTMIFLPATFVATLFSTSFFNFQAEQGATVVSGRIWIYILLTAVLTTLVYVAWVLLFKGDEVRELKKFLKRHVRRTKAVRRMAPGDGTQSETALKV